MHAVILPVLGIASLFAMQFVSVLQGRGVIALPFSSPQIIFCLLLGILAGALMVGPYLARRYIPMLLLCISAMSGFFWYDSIVNDHGISSYTACALGGMLLPPVLLQLFAVSKSPGLHLGLALALGDFFWLFLYFVPQPFSSLALQGILAALVILGGVLSAIAYGTTAPQQEIPRPLASPLGRQSAYYLAAIAFVFFLQNALLDIPYYRMHSASFTIPAQVHLYIWAVYPVCGWFIDKYGADIRLFLVCVAGNIFSPALVGFSEGTAVYWGIYAATLASRTVGLIFLLLVFARIRNKFTLPAFVVALPFMALLASLEVVYQLVARFPGTTYMLLFSLFLVASFSYISSRIQYALTLAGILKPARSKNSATDYDSTELICNAQVLAHFTEKYGISTREQDVLQLVVEGQSTKAVSENLHISENTVKSHIRQLLRKTESENRISLVALFFNEAQQVAGAQEHS